MVMLCDWKSHGSWFGKVQTRVLARVFLGKSRTEGSGANTLSLSSNWIADFLKGTVIVLVFTLFSVLLHGEPLRFPEVAGDTKNVIVDSLLAVDELSGSIFYRRNYTTVDVCWQEGLTYIGDYYDWGFMYHFASIGYLSFGLPYIPEGYYLQSATLSIYIQAMKGNSVLDVYPVFNVGNTLVFPEGILEHIDYGDSFNSVDVIPLSVYGTCTLFNHESLTPHSWINYDVTNSILSDISSNRTLSQYRIYLNGFSDWDNRDDFVIYSSHSSSHGFDAPKIIYILADWSSNNDSITPRPTLLVSCYPNPFRSINTILVKASKPGSCKLRIYNLKGQLIRRQSANLDAAGGYSFQWDGRDDAGRQVGGGIYLAEVEAGGCKVIRKVLYLR